MVAKYPQKSYSTVVCTVQSEWIFLKRVIKYMEQKFAGVENFLQETFLPCLFFGKSKTSPPLIGSLSMLPVNKSGMGLHNPVASVKDKYNSLLCLSCKLIGTVTGERAFSNADHVQVVKGERWDGKKYWGVVNDAKLPGIFSNQGAFKNAYSSVPNTWMPVWAYGVLR